MIAVDTNVVVRFLTRDDVDQFVRSEKCLRENEVFVPDTVLLETVTVSSSERVALALTAFERGLDFADAVHLAGSQDAAETRDV